MPYSVLNKASWEVDPKFLEFIPGGKHLLDWLGFSTVFHDGDILSMSLQDRSAILQIAAFRMTNQTDEKGFYILDRHAKVTIRLENITGIWITGVVPNQVLELGFRNVAQDHELPTNCLAKAGDLELAYDDVYGGGGSIFAESASISFLPSEENK